MPMDEDKRLHLELIQGIIKRLAQNSFAMKGWAVTLISAIFALLKEPALHIAILPAFVFWGLDAYYLRQERLFRKLYDAVRLGGKSGGTGTAATSGGGTVHDPFSMDTVPFQKEVKNWRETLLAGTIVWLYLPMILLIGAISFLPESLRIRTPAASTSPPGNSGPASQSSAAPPYVAPLG